jgi:hypothetical protein
MLKSIATGQYVPPEERQQAEEATGDEQQDDTTPETEVPIESMNAEESEPVVGDTSVDPEAKSE